MAKLVIYEELEEEETIFEDFDLSAHRIIIGSSEDSNLILDMPDIDPAHASLEYRSNYWVIQDLGGPGGTLLNGEIVDGPHRLEDNDLIELQSVKIRFLENDVLFGEDDTPVLGQASPMAKPAKPISGRVWFGTVAGMTLVVIFVILLLLIVADYLDILRLADLIPFGMQ